MCFLPPNQLRQSTEGIRLTITLTLTQCWCYGQVCYYYFASAAVAVDSGHMTASSYAAWNRLSPPSNFVNGHVPTMWFMVCRWPQWQEGDWACPHLCKLARHWPWLVRKRFVKDHAGWGRSESVLAFYCGCKRSTARIYCCGARSSYNNATVRINLRRTSNLLNILRRTQGFS